ncbi:MAG: transporter substrate-binding domain-containing protein [Alkalispirochaeta sp.]
MWAQRSTANDTITIAAEPDYRPYSFVNDYGEPDGFGVELFLAAADAVGITVEVRSGLWKDIKEDLAEGRIDALPVVGRTPEREDYFDFTVPYISMYGGIVVAEDEREIKTLDDLKGRRIAVMSGDNAEEFLRRAGFDDEIVPTSTFSDAMEAVRKGSADAVVVQRIVALQILGEEGYGGLRLLDDPIPDFVQDFCFAVTEGDKELLALLNEGLAIVVADGTFRRLQSRWFSPMQIPSRKIIVGGDDNYPPFEYLDERGRPTGYNVDLTRAIARELGLDIEIRLGPWSQILGMLRRGEIDAVQGMLYSRERDEIYDFGPPHTVHHNVAIAVGNEGDSLPDSAEELRGRRIVVQDGDVMHDYVLREGITSDLIVVQSQEAALETLRAGDADYALGSRLSALRLIDARGWDDLVVGKTGIVSTDYGYAVREGNIAVLSYFSEGMALLEDTGEFREIYDQWLGVYEPYTPDPRKVIRLILLILGPLVLLLAGTLTWVITLRREVARHTAELEENQRTLEAANATLEQSLEENRTLLKEIHHRVKNNLNVIVSLLRLQEEQVVDLASARDAFEASRNRIYSMALVHESLYKAETFSEIELSGYIRDLIHQIKGSITGDEEIVFHLDLMPVTLDIQQAVPCGIILNELVTNARKHAFHDTGNPTIDVSLVCDAAGSITLTVADNGSGLPDDFSPEESSTLGWTLITILVKQIDGEVTVIGDGGTTVVVTLNRVFM